MGANIQNKSKSNYNSSADKDDGSYVYDDIIYTDQTQMVWSLVGNEYISAYNYSVITQDVLDRGYVLTYIDDGSGQWSQIPLSQANGTTGEVLTIQEEHYVGGGEVRFSSSFGIPPNPGITYLKVVVIEDRSALQGVDVSQLEEVIGVLPRE